MDPQYHENYNLLIVESPTKAATISKYLKDDDDEWIVASTGGHIKDLPLKRMGLSYSEDEVQGEWEFISKDTAKRMQEIKQMAKHADAVYIATDDDREGERIASDVAEYLGVAEYYRVAFSEITQKSILQELYMSTREIHDKVVEAATANRYIDRELGYGISSILSADMKKNHGDKYKVKGVGRVISPGLAMICEIDRQRAAFVPEKYYQIAIDYVYNGRSFRVHNKQKFRPEDEPYMNRYITALQTSDHVVTKYDEKVEDVVPYEPLHTSSMQYSAWYVLEIMPEDSMRIAQRLFELGLITYHRTDSVRMSKQAIKEVRNAVAMMFPEEYLSPEPRIYTNKKKKPKKKEGENENSEGKEQTEPEEPAVSSEENIQDAHEAIRPTQFTPNYYPKNISKPPREGGAGIKLDKNEFELYRLVWARTLITQMSDSRYDRSSLVITIGDEEFGARANEPLFDGWEKISKDVMNLSKIKSLENWREETVKIPKLRIDEKLYPLEILPQEHTTKRPRRYGVGTFISAVHTMGFARPSTIGTLIKTLTEKGYIEVVKGILNPTKLGIIVDDWTTKHFPWLNDVAHAKIFEDELTRIESGEIEIGDSLVIEYHKKVEEGAAKLGVDISKQSSNLPSEAQVAKIKSISNKHGIIVGDEIFRNREKANVWLNKYAKTSRVKKCPYCENGDINEHDDYFKCTNNECKFIITKKRIIKFFEIFKREVEEDELVDIIKGMTLKKGYKAEGLIRKNGDVFSANLVVEHDDKYGWGVGFRKHESEK
jgi:DNA topoisomerase-1